MTGPTTVLAASMTGEHSVRVAAAGDVHVDDSAADSVAIALAAMDRDADVILLAGDLTTHGQPEQAEVLARACRDIETPVIAVLGNHDLHAGREREVSEALAGGGIVVLDRDRPAAQAGSGPLGVAGVKGFVGGFGAHTIPDWGEGALRALYAETGAEVDALSAGLREIANCPLRIVLMHYAPTAETLHGEPPEIWSMLGSERLAAPILEHKPDLVLHGHAHAGRLRGSLQRVPVYNVSIPVMAKDYWLFELTAGAALSRSLH